MSSHRHLGLAHEREYAGRPTQRTCALSPPLLARHTGLVSNLNPEDDETVRRFASWKPPRRQAAPTDTDALEPQQIYRADESRVRPALRNAGLRGSSGRSELPSTH